MATQRCRFLTFQAPDTFRRSKFISLQGKNKGSKSWNLFQYLLLYSFNLRDCMIACASLQSLLVSRKEPSHLSVLKTLCASGADWCKTQPRPTSQHEIYGGFTMHNATCIDSLCWRSSKALILVENQHCFKSNTILTADRSLRGRPTIQEPSKSRRPPASESSNIHSSQVLRAASGCYTFPRASSTVRSEKGWPA